jgi:hypothetical protein
MTNNTHIDTSKWLFSIKKNASDVCSWPSCCLATEQKRLNVNYREQSPWEVKSLSANQKKPRHLWNMKAYYGVHKNPQVVTILSQMNSVHNGPSWFSKIHSNTILSSTPRLSMWSLPFTFSIQNFILLQGPPISSLIWSNYQCTWKSTNYVH